jgi:hypothetical protein
LCLPVPNRIDAGIGLAKLGLDTVGTVISKPMWMKLAVCWVALCTSATLIARPTVQAPANPVATASAKTWVGKSDEIEAQLKTAEITSMEDIGTGVTNPRRAHLQPGEPVESLVWKVLPPGRRGGYWESYKSEIAAYELDKLLRMNMVPPAIERSIGEETGAAVMWIGSIKSVKELGGKVPSGPSWGRPLRIMMMFDNLIANIDRNAGNILVGPPGELILIDHSRAFTTDKKLVQKVERVDALLWDRMTALTRDDLTRSLGSWLESDQIAAMIQRRDEMAAAVDKLVAKKGRSLVIIQ